MFVGLGLVTSKLGLTQNFNKKSNVYVVNQSLMLLFFVITLLVFSTYLNFVFSCQFFNLKYNDIITNYVFGRKNSAEAIFLSLFLLMVPVTLFILVRSEKFTTLFVLMNFFFLLVVVLIIIDSQDIIGLVLGYELLLLPAFLIMRRTLYSAAGQSAYSVFLVWSVVGSLIVVTSALLLLALTEQTKFYEHSVNQTFALLSQENKNLISFLFFLGFGVKIPI